MRKNIIKRLSDGKYLSKMVSFFDYSLNEWTDDINLAEDNILGRAVIFERNFYTEDNFEIVEKP